MARQSRDDAENGSDCRQFAVGLGRAFTGALLFSLPILMTGEMWELGRHIDPFRLALLLVLNLAFLTRLSSYGGFRHTSSIWDGLADALVAFVIAIFCSAVLLRLQKTVRSGHEFHDTGLFSVCGLDLCPGSGARLVGGSDAGRGGDAASHQCQGAGFHRGRAIY